MAPTYPLSPHVFGCQKRHGIFFYVFLCADASWLLRWAPHQGFCGTFHIEAMPAHPGLSQMPLPAHHSLCSSLLPFLYTTKFSILPQDLAFCCSLHLECSPCHLPPSLLLPSAHPSLPQGSSPHHPRLDQVLPLEEFGAAGISLSAHLHFICRIIWWSLDHKLQDIRNIVWYC